MGTAFVITRSVFFGTEPRRHKCYTEVERVCLTRDHAISALRERAEWNLRVHAGTDIEEDLGNNGIFVDCKDMSILLSFEEVQIS